MVVTDYGPDSLTESGYGRIAKLWKRGTPLASARTVLEGVKADVAAELVPLRGAITSPAHRHINRHCPEGYSVLLVGDRGDGLTTEIWWAPTYPFKSSLTGQSAQELADAYEMPADIVDGMSAEAVARRIQPVASVEVRDASDTASLPHSGQ